MIKELLKHDFGYELDIAGGTGQSKDDPIHVLSPLEKDVIHTESLVLRGIGKGRGILWRTLQTELVDGTEIIQRKIETKEASETEIITQVENYYFLRKNIPSHSESSKDIVFLDEQAGIAFPYEISWLHYDGITDYSTQGKGELGYSLAYNAPEIKATIYVYPKVVSNTETNVLEGELEVALADIRALYGSDEIEHVWEAIIIKGYILYYYFPKHSPQETSLLLIMRKGNYFVKLRCSFIDDEFMRTISNDFCDAFVANVQD